MDLNVQFDHKIICTYEIDYIKQILNCICIRCSKLLINKDTELSKIMKYKSGKERFSEIRNIIKNLTHCRPINYGCGTPIHKIKLETNETSGTINMTAESNEKRKLILTPEICFDILLNISDNDCMILSGSPEKSRPEAIMHKIFYSKPTKVRSCFKVDYSESSNIEENLDDFVFNVNI